jgi:uncharacterized protein
MTRYIYAGFVLFFVSLSGQAASFNCDKVVSQVEKLICENAKLSTLDESLATTNTQALAKANMPDVVRTQQRGWVNNVRNRCSEVKCLGDAYAARITQLASVPNFVNRDSSRSRQSSEDTESCQAVAHYANRDELTSLKVEFLASSKNDDQLKSIFGNEPELYGSTVYMGVDFNNDGKRDDLLITATGTMRVGRAYVRFGGLGASVETVDESESGIYDLSVLAIGGNYYILSSDGNLPHKLWRMGRGGSVDQVCTFQARPPVVQLTVGQRKPVCNAVSNHRIQYVSYNFTHHFVELPHEDRYWSMYPTDGMAKADIDNDGKSDNVTEISYNSSAGRGCMLSFLATLDASGSNLPDNDLNRLLIGELRGAVCGAKQHIFVFGKQTYLDSSFEDGNRYIYLIKGNKAETACQYSGRILVDVTHND